MSTAWVTVSHLRPTNHSSLATTQERNDEKNKNSVRDDRKEEIMLRAFPFLSATIQQNSSFWSQGQGPGAKRPSVVVWVCTCACPTRNHGNGTSLIVLFSALTHYSSPRVGVRWYPVAFHPGRNWPVMYVLGPAGPAALSGLHRRRYLGSVLYLRSELFAVGLFNWKPTRNIFFFFYELIKVIQGAEQKLFFHFNFFAAIPRIKRCKDIGRTRNDL